MIIDESHEGMWAVIWNDKWITNPPSMVPMQIVSVTSHRVRLTNGTDDPFLRAKRVVIEVFQDREVAIERAQAAYALHKRLQGDIQRLTEERDASVVAIVRGVGDGPE